MTTITLEGKEYQLDTEQAKKLNLLKEKDNRVKSWEEFKEKYKSNIAYGFVDLLGVEKFPGGISSTRTQLTPHEAKALTAFSKLLKLRRDWIGEWEPDWKDVSTSYGVIWVSKNEVKVNVASTLSFPLSFPDYKMAQEFLETFHDLIEEAKTLL
jgi:cyclopropane fatty-acyl-phospholipid synthase-like methyltransferase